MGGFPKAAHALSWGYVLYQCPPLAELSDILSRRKFDQKVAESGFSIDELVARYADLATHVRPVEIPRLAPDPDDDVVIGTAIAAQAHFVVTGDKALLSLKRYDGGRILTVFEALKAVVQASFL